MQQQSVENSGETAEEKQELFISQRNYRPTPYEASIWEAVGERVKEKNFIALNLEVLRDRIADSDPMFEDFDRGKQLHSGQVFQTPGGELSSIVSEAEQSAGPGISEELLQQMLAEKFEEGRAAGIAEGKRSAEAAVARHYEELSARMKEITDGIQRQIAQHLEEVERRALDMSLRIAKMLVQTTVEAKPEYILDVIRQALKNTGVAQPKVIRVSQQDYEFLDVVGLPPELSETELGVKYVPDDAIQSGCIVETDFGDVNLELEPMWEKIKDKLYKMV